MPARASSWWEMTSASDGVVAQREQEVSAPAHRHSFRRPWPATASPPGEMGQHVGLEVLGGAAAGLLQQLSCARSASPSSSSASPSCVRMAGDADSAAACSR